VTAIPPALERALGDRYRLERTIGQGGMAIVYLATDLKHDRSVAIKALHPDLAAGIGRERFRREIEIAASLSHPHVLPLIDSGTTDDLVYYIVPYVAGETLRARLDREGRLGIDEALRLTLEIGSALAHAHDRGLVHRDIKPENVLLADGHVQVADFGIAHAPRRGGSTLTAAGTLLGTPAYMSPEQAAGGADVDARSDIYSLGCVLYEMLAGRAPFIGPPESVLYQHLSTTPAPIAEFRHGVPREIADALVIALAKTRTDRYATVGAFTEALTTPVKSRAAAASVAVLPFQNLSADPENEYFADGITEDVIAHLAKVRTLKVISRSSVMPFKKSAQSPREIATRLGVTTLLEGTVRRAGDRVRIVVELIDAVSERNLWADTYDRQLTDIFVIQSDVARSITAALKTELSANERSRIEREPTNSIHAYELYLRGRQCLTDYSATELRRSIGFFERAIEIDPDYAMAHAGIAFAYADLGDSGFESGLDTYPRAQAAAARALEIDPDLGDAHTMSAYVKMLYDFDWAGAEEGFRRALSLSPGSADAHSLYGRLCSSFERWDEAIAMQERAFELDPLAHRVDVATTLLRAGRYDEAEGAAERALRLDPEYPRASATLGWVHFKQGRTEQGLRELTRASELSPTDNMWLAQLGQACAIAGETGRARDILRRLEDGTRHVMPYHLAYVYAGLGELDRAMDLLEESVRARAGAAYGIRGSFLWAPLHGHPRFVALLRSMGLA
jgi:eukaryotic-like serine/threonine-protein kinase